MVEISLSSLPSGAAVAYDDWSAWAPSRSWTDSSARTLGHDKFSAAAQPPHGHFLTGSMARYNAHMIPALVKGLKAKSYLPRPDASPWSDRWSRARYRFSLEVNEQLEGLLYDNARSQIDEKFTFALSHMPECGQAAPSGKL